MKNPYEFLRTITALSVVIGLTACATPTPPTREAQLITPTPTVEPTKALVAVATATPTPTETRPALTPISTSTPEFSPVSNVESMIVRSPDIASIQKDMGALMATVAEVQSDAKTRDGDIAALFQKLEKQSPQKYEFIPAEKTNGLTPRGILKVKIPGLPVYLTAEQNTTSYLSQPRPGDKNMSLVTIAWDEKNPPQHFFLGLDAKLFVENGVAVRYNPLSTQANPEGDADSAFLQTMDLAMKRDKNIKGFFTGKDIKGALIIENNDIPLIVGKNSPWYPRYTFETRTDGSFQNVGLIGATVTFIADQDGRVRIIENVTDVNFFDNGFVTYPDIIEANLKKNPVYYSDGYKEYFSGALGHCFGIIVNNKVDAYGGYKFNPAPSDTIQMVQLKQK